MILDSPIPPHSPTAKKPASAYSAEFEQFWQAYPKKTGKGAAFGAWKKNHHPPVTEILTVLERASRTTKWLEDDGRYVPNPATWLNQKRWDDEYTPIDATDAQSVEQVRAIFRRQRP